jgi:hypothetical protein
VSAPPPRAHLRAALLALHLFAIVISALPSAGAGLDRKAWANPTVQEEFGQWRDRLAGLGVQLTLDELQDLAFGFASGWNEVHTALQAPFQPYYRLATRQSWRMFVAPHRHPGRLHVDIDHGTGWEPLYVARSSAHTWRGHQLDHDRFRSALFRYAWPAYQRAGRWKHLVQWLARQAAADFPDAVRIRARYETFRTPSPAEVREDRRPPSRFTSTRIERLDRFR